MTCECYKYKNIKSCTQHIYFDLCTTGSLWGSNNYLYLLV